MKPIIASTLALLLLVAPLIARQPADQWIARADWREWDHRSQLAG